MLIKTLLNKVYRFKSFTYGKVEIAEINNEDALLVEIKARKNSHPLCGQCGKAGTCYDHQAERRYEFIPILGVKVFFLYKPRRVDCVICGARTERVPWSSGKSSQTVAYSLFLSHWARLLSWQGVAKEFRTSWGKVFRAIEYVVNWGLEHRDLSGVKAIGIDEIAINLGHNYATLVYQIDSGSKRLLWIGKGRTAKTLLRFFRLIGRKTSSEIEHVCSDMWKAYLKVIKKKIPQAIHILDRFHIVANVNKALDEVRATEAKKLASQGYEQVLHKSRWCFLKRAENLSSKQSYKLSELLKYNLVSVRAYLLKEDLNQLWKYNSAYFAGKFIDAWTTRVMRSKIEPLKKQAKSIRKHKPLILNWFKAKKLFSSGIVEGFNCKAKLTIRKAYGFRTFNALQIALYHQMGALPEPKLTHSLW